jgi:hypothetical protein
MICDCRLLIDEWRAEFYSRAGRVACCVLRNLTIDALDEVQSAIGNRQS